MRDTAGERQPPKCLSLVIEKRANRLEICDLEIAENSLTGPVSRQSGDHGYAGKWWRDSPFVTNLHQRLR